MTQFNDTFNKAYEWSYMEYIFMEYWLLLVEIKCSEWKHSATTRKLHINSVGDYTI